MIIGLGTDIVSIERIAKVLEKKLLDFLFLSLYPPKKCGMLILYFCVE